MRAEHAGWPEGRLNDQQLESILRGLHSLPTFPGVAGRLLKLTRAPAGEPPDRDASLPPQVTQLVGSDPALTAYVLSAAGRCDPQHRPRTAEQAVRTMGPAAIRSMALTVGTFPAAGGTPAIDSGLDHLGLWQHCLAVAIAAEQIAERLGMPVEPGLAFVCGLLHDLGKITLEQCFPKSYAKVLSAAAARKGNVAEFERAVIGADHAQAGRRLAALWRLPEPLPHVLWLHHQAVEAVPEAIPDAPLVRLVGLADTVARELGLGFSGNYQFARTSGELARQVGLPEEALDEITETLAEQVQQRSAALVEAVDRGEALYQRAVADATAELARLNEQLNRRAVLAGGQARAFRQLRQLAAALGPEATVAETLLQAARAVAADRGHAPSRRQPVVAYSLAEGGDVLAVRCTGDRAPDYRVLTRSAPGEPDAPGDTAAPAGDAIAALLGEPAALSDWLDASAYLHQPLLCAGRWVGGVLVPGQPQAAQTAAGDDVCTGLAAAVALALAVVQGRSRAVAVGEQLAQASQVLAQTQEALAEAKALSATAELAAGAAHELNTPLAIISGRAQLMASKARSEQQRETWQLVAEQAQRISDIITELMELARPPKPRPEPFNLAEVIHSAVDAFSSSDHPKAGSLRVDIQVDEGTPPVLADKAQTQAVIEELIANAATAADGPPQVTLAANADETSGAVLLTVADRGPGMDAQTLANAFVPFYSAQQAGRRRGLGLPRARRFVETNGGSLWIRSEPGEGTTVYVELPPAAAEEQDDVGQ